ncbi:hypothetical protein U14_01916 [Candidatus Moduliflexus flocculans]|uniref:Uncharacterized protein n=1 Tax=Candidatus Moduliflexus flocculans TaxID=1499966 RepID=A0A0S6VT38_9BACT|nr:hypothetical protein U14_01916 [Candidatus Moduliflexus flocculans]
MRGHFKCTSKGATALTLWGQYVSNAFGWLDHMGYPLSGKYHFPQAGYPLLGDIDFPSKEAIKSNIMSPSTKVFYEIAHGGSTFFQNRCIPFGNITYTFDSISDKDVQNWLESREPMTFAFIASCGGMCNTNSGSLSNAFRKGQHQNTATVGYCGMDTGNCGDKCWDDGYAFLWQDVFFRNLAQGETMITAYEKAHSIFLPCNSCIRFEGDPSLKLLPPVAPNPTPVPTQQPTPTPVPTPVITSTPQPHKICSTDDAEAGWYFVYSVGVSGACGGLIGTPWIGGDTAKVEVEFRNHLRPTNAWCVPSNAKLSIVPENGNWYYTCTLSPAGNDQVYVQWRW